MVDDFHARVRRLFHASFVPHKTDSKIFLNFYGYNSLGCTEIEAHETGQTVIH